MGIKSATYTIPHIMETDPDVFFGVHLAVTDPNGYRLRSTATFCQER